VTITPKDVLGTPHLIATTFAGLAREVGPGARILLSDGLIELRVRGRQRQDVECDVVNGGLLAEHQGINLPGVALTIPALTDKDRKDLEFGLKHDVDMVAISFVRSASDVREVKQLILDHGGNVPVIAKLEKPQALEQLEEIFEAADGVMVARGDLGVETALEKVPRIQKSIIRRARRKARFVITATQMLESMTNNPTPTRAEASDVANGVYEGADALMLSAESAVGAYPCEAVAIMDAIIRKVEADPQWPRLMRAEHGEDALVAGPGRRASGARSRNALPSLASTCHPTRGPGHY
jgi:pyruvate kinase